MYQVGKKNYHCDSEVGPAEQRCLKISAYMDYCDLEKVLQFGNSQRLVKENKILVLMVLPYSEYLAAKFRYSSFRVLNYQTQLNSETCL